MPVNLNTSISFSQFRSADDNRVSTGFERVSSGKRINSALDDAAGISIASRFAKNIDGFTVAARNAGDGISLVQVADGNLNSLTSNLERIRELALSAANGTLTDQDRGALAAEAEQLQAENQSILEGASFNGVSLLNDANASSLQVGPNASDTLSVGGVDLSSVLDGFGLNDVDISTQDGAVAALDVLDQASEEVSAVRADFGAVANRLESTIDTLEQARENESAARSRIEDADLAKELAEISAGLVQEQVGIAVQSQANAQKGFVLQLLQ